MDFNMVKVARCPSQYSGSDTISGFGGSGTGIEVIDPGSGKQHRVRTVRLVRPTSGTAVRITSGRPGATLGFSIRGGREHGTGFFVSAVQPGSEAQRQGLKVGDQIVRINGFAIEDAIHKEVLQLIANHKHITLKVRYVGMVPIKEKVSDPLEWQIIEDSNSIKRASPIQRDTRISIVVTPRSKLGCGICKGPEWKPGIFIQFTKEGGIAHDVGLRPGDQILLCNDVDFNTISFNEAVHMLKSSRQLELLVRQGAGLELVTAESSGYNSSASSITGDQSPSSIDSKRLSIVKEETLELEDRLSQLDLRSKSKLWNDSKWVSNDSDATRSCKPTIITLSENETTIQNNGTAEVCQPTQTFNRNATVETVAQVHRSESDEDKKPQPIVKNSEIPKPPAEANSLSSAIYQELQRRSERNKAMQKSNSIETTEPRKSISDDARSKHDILMDEFKKAHLKMLEKAQNKNKNEENKDQEVSILKPSTKPKAPPVPKKVYPEIPPCPPCPVPDYDTLSKNNKNTEVNGKSINDKVEMESLESFRLNNPDAPEPKPPRTYFNKPKPKLTGQSSISSATSIDSMATIEPTKKRTVSVTFSEYPSGTEKRQPGRFGFLTRGKTLDSDDQDGEPITSRLANELSQTLMRANLRNQENLNNLPNKPTNGNPVIISVNNSNTMTNGSSFTLTNPNKNGHKPLTKSQSVNQIPTPQLQTFGNGQASNKLTIRILDSTNTENATST